MKDDAQSCTSKLISDGTLARMRNKQDSPVTFGDLSKCRTSDIVARRKCSSYSPNALMQCCNKRSLGRNHVRPIDRDPNGYRDSYSSGRVRDETVWRNV